MLGSVLFCRLLWRGSVKVFLRTACCCQKLGDGSHLYADSSHQGWFPYSVIPAFSKVLSINEFTVLGGGRGFQRFCNNSTNTFVQKKRDDGEWGPLIVQICVTSLMDDLIML
jgi:hypothetical protein